MSVVEHNGGINLDQFHPVPVASALDAFSGAACTMFEEYLHTTSNKFRLAFEK